MTDRVTGQFADKPTHGQSIRGPVNSQASQLSKIFERKFGVHNRSKCDFG